MRSKVTALVVGLACLVATPARSQIRPPELSERSVQPSPLPGTVVTLDLAQVAPGSTTAFDVPRGTIQIELANRAPALDYNARGGPMRVGEETYPPRSLMSFRGYRPPAPIEPQAEPACQPARSAFIELLALRDERRVPALLSQVKDPPAACKRERGWAQILARNPFNGPVMLVGGVEKVTVERLEGGVATATWTILLRGPARQPGWSYGNETEWLASEVLGDVARLVEFAKTRRLGSASLRLEAKPPADGLAAFGVRHGSKAWPDPGVTLTIRTHAWSPSDYQPLAKAWLAAAGLRGASHGTLSPIAADLTDLSPARLVSLSRSLSKLLSENPLDARVHEQAAFLLGVSAWREGVSYFGDTRPAMCGMATHLSLAGALRGSAAASPEGQLASLMLELLAERTVPARETYAGLQTSLGASSARSWVLALGLRLELDRRRLADPAEPSLLLRVEHVRALERLAGQEAALAFLDRHPAGSEPDWGRFLLPGNVELSHAFADGAVERELTEARVLLELPGGDLAAVAKAAALADGPRMGSEPLPQVASRAFWAANVRRQLLAAAAAERYHLGAMLGLDEKAKARWQELEAALGALSQLAIVRVAWTTGNESTQPCREIEETLLSKTPQLVSGSAWWLVTRRCLALRGGGTLTLPTAWFTSGPVPGTAFENGARLDIPEIEDRLSVADWDRLKALHPRAREIREGHARAHGRELSAADVRVAFGEAASWNRAALETLLALKPAPEETARLLGSLCEVDGLTCMRLGQELRDRDPVAAAKAFEQGLRTARDQVAASHSVDWLLDYHLDNGRAKEALEQAARVARTYSSSGLSAQARVFERLGRLAEAEKVYRAEQERYADLAELDAFYIRQSRRQPGGPYAEAGKTALAKLFPQGFKTTALTALSPIQPFKSSDVVMFMKADIAKVYEGLGVQPRDMLRTVDGIEVTTRAQFRCARSLSDSREINLVVQRAGKLVELRGPYQRAKYGPVARLR